MPKPFQIGFTPFLVALLLQLAPPPSFSANNSYIAIIIDDIGHNQRAGERAIDIQAHLTFAVIPETQHAARLASYAHNAGKEVMVHLPMANTMNQPLGGLALTNGLSEQDIAKVLDQAVRLVPFAAGINNHMGSALTQEPQAMIWLMRAVKRHKLFFIDSRTTHKTVALEIALQENIRTASRDVFLDNDRSPYGIDKEFRRLLTVAKRRRTAIAIGHPYPATLQYLEHAIPMLKREGVRLISVSEILKLRLAERQLTSY
ncbi:divergent polysaccharide deacetylase family protein [Gammaproteobacteria bacterium]|nr:divergent polysaccharide deacetylase family protein [Gammaproteobacteria bacterium]